MTPAEHLVLIGMMGVGKSTAGSLLARRWSRPFFDTDEEVERRSGRSVQELFASEGEAGFRRRETEVVTDLLESDRPAVVACGGGVIVEAGNRARLARRSTVVWLTAPVDVLALRVGDAETRPLLGDDPSVNLGALLDQRRPLYEQVADHVVDTADRSPETVAARIEQVVG